MQKVVDALTWFTIIIVILFYGALALLVVQPFLWPGD